MPPKAKTPAPIDRPLSRAYLRQFTGWSSAFPPGVSDPTSLRIMENTQVQRDGSLRIRPGLRAACVPTGLPSFQGFVGSQEPFYLNSGTKAYLQAVRELDGSVGFRVLADLGIGLTVHELDETSIGFSIPQGIPTLRFTSATSYVKYLQIDNKIFALSNAGESMRYFTVGATKTAKRLNAIERPSWDVAEKLTVVHPTQAWISSGVPISSRVSTLDNQSFETNTAYWSLPLGVFGGTYVALDRVTSHAMVGGSASGRLATLPFRINYVTQPLGAPAPSLGSWGLGSGTAGIPGATLGIDGTTGRMRFTMPPGSSMAGSTRFYFNSPVMMPIDRLRPQDGSIPAQYWLEYNLDVTGMPLGNSGPGALYDPGVMIRWFNASGVQVGGDQTGGPAYLSFSGGHFHMRAYFGSVPFGATHFQAFPFLATRGGGLLLAGGGYWEMSEFSMLADPEATGWFDGDSGTGYFWTGAANNSTSVHHSDAHIEVYGHDNNVSAGATYTGSFYLRAGTTGRHWSAILVWIDSGGNVIGTDAGATTADVNTSWTRLHCTATAPPGAVNCALTVYSVDDIGRGEYHYIDDAMFELGALQPYFDGNVPDTSTETYDWVSGVPFNGDSRVIEYSGPIGMPPAATPTAATLISSDPTKNVYNFGFFYTFANEVGESAASQVTVVKCQRGWSQWRWETATVAAEPSTTHTDDPNLCADQLVAYMPPGVFQDAMDQGATKWNLYTLTWSDQDPAPVAAVRLSSRTLPTGAAHDSYGYQRQTPQQADANAEIASLPSEVNRFNYSTPSSAGQGIVAADRMVMVFDPLEPAVIRWSSNEMGKYSDFTANKGGGFKTLSSGNLNVPSSVVLWQNPQSADTITILCQGTDGYSSGYYMAPAQIASQSEAVNIMGFEETTATPGTVAPYGVEVLNNALYHPLEDMLMKSSAMNYNISHSSMTDAIQDSWMRLADKKLIVSTVSDNRIYYLVHNPLGAPREVGCWGNEVWVLDAQAKAGSWSRWLVQGQSLRKFEHGGKTYVALTTPRGLFYFDPLYALDDYVNTDDVLTSRAIPWRIETNTQGANRAHDAWAHLQQANIVLGNFQGSMHYGIRGLDIHGKMVDISKEVLDVNPPSTDSTMWDIDSYLLIRRDIKEWFFYAGSVTGIDDVVMPSQGQINLVQYRYTPSTVNTGYEYGSVETFEYARAANADDDRTTVNGVPKPMIDVGRP